MKKNMPRLHYLAMGDSYTIGESVPFMENFPNQVASILASKLSLETRIIAKTGWTTDELAGGIQKAEQESPLLSAYDFVTLLIGVNNQYRGRSAKDYAVEFKNLIQLAIRYSGNRPEHVVVLSIPDWGVTPYAEGRDRKQIGLEIDNFNLAAKKSAEQAGIYFIDITTLTREAANDPSLLTSDGLHPSGKEYKRWAELVAAYFLSKIS